MSTSNVKRVQNEIDLIVSSSEKIVGEDMYYIVDIIIRDLDRESMIKFAKKLLSEREEQPLVVYLYEGNVKLLFPPSRSEKYHKLISEYISKSYLYGGTSEYVECQVLEMKSQKDVLMYFTFIVHWNEQNSFIRESNGQISRNDVLKKTRSELFDILHECSVDWEQIKSHDRYGTFYKIRYSKKKYVITSMSEIIDYREGKKYTSFLFNSN